MRTSWLAHLDARVPRYTSYPTAPHFHAGIGPETMEGWLARADLSKPVSLYLHIPFCRKLCWYCGCNTTIVRIDQPVIDFAEVLLREIDLVAARLPGRARIGHLHFGGGSPNSLPADTFRAVMDRIDRHFDRADGAEIAIEIDPRSLGDDQVAAYAACGLTRASLGVQDFDRAVQRAINRVQPPEMVARAVEKLRGAGIAGINFDLLYGLPLQSEETLARTVATTAEMRPDRVALFGYAHVPWMKKYQRALERFALPGIEARGAMAAAARAGLEDAGYTAIGIDHFALPEDELAVAQAEGRLARNFQGYTTDAAETLIAVGPSAIAATAEGYTQNESEPGPWAEAVNAGRLPTRRGIALGAEDRLRRAVIERLMCDLSVDLAEMATAHGFEPSVFSADLYRVAPLAAEGMACTDGWRIVIPPEARIAVRSVASAFDAYLGQGQARHAAAV